LNNYTLLDANHGMRTESGEAEFNFVSSQSIFKGTGKYLRILKLSKTSTAN